MNQEKYIEVTIIESAAEIPTSDTCSVKCLSTIHEQNNPKVARPSVENNVQKSVPISSSLKSNVEYLPSLQQGRNSIQKSHQPLDIELLLRYYACTSNMEQSINNVLENRNEKSFEGPLLELGAATKICDTLKEPSSTGSILTTFRFHNILSRLRHLIGTCNKNKLEQILSNDPSMKMCKYCGVISCSKSSNIPVEPRKSPPNTSYFLSTDIFSNEDDDSTIHKQVKKLNPKKTVEKDVTRRRKINRKKGNEINGNSGRVETMIAERENDSQVNARKSVKNEAESQVTKSPPFKREVHKTAVATKNAPSQQTKMNPAVENKDIVKNSADANFTNNFSSDKRFRLLDSKQRLIENTLNHKRNNLNVDEPNEKVVKDILYEKSTLRLPECTHVGSVRNVNTKENQSNNLEIGSPPFVNTTTYLARGRPESLDKRNKEFVSQLDERTCVHSRRPEDQHSFILHTDQIDNPQLNLDSLKIHSKLSPNDTSSNPKNFQESNSFTCLMEDDSLENCIKSETLVESSESDTTVISSSSAENMIRKWVKSLRIDNETRQKSVTLKHSMDDLQLDTKLRSLWNNDRSIKPTSIKEEHNLGSHILRKISHSVPSKRPKNTFGQTMSYTLDSKSPNDQQLLNNKIRASSFRNIESCGGKRLFGSFRRAMRSKEMDLNVESFTFPGNHFLGDHFRNITRRIIYNDSSLKNISGNSETCDGAENILLLYRKILESTEKMNWQNFQRFIEELHPNQKEVWRNICMVIDNEARRLADKGNTEVCIEITSAPLETTMEDRTCNDEIVFEMDITLEEVKRCLGRQLGSTEKAKLDILQTANEVIKLRNDDVCDTEVVFNQAE
nr:uncharacterized protein LOC117603847 [Osmia lignaria]XP_034179261.1 uncharacterized protein LOC117603847 [Osmia lignaria]